MKEHPIHIFYKNQHDPVHNIQAITLLFKTDATISIANENQKVNAVPNRSPDLPAKLLGPNPEAIDVSDDIP